MSSVFIAEFWQVFADYRNMVRLNQLDVKLRSSGFRENKHFRGVPRIPKNI